jgi:hypothetical protein
MTRLLLACSARSPRKVASLGVVLAAALAGVASLGMIAPAGAAAAFKCGEPPENSLFFNGSQREGVIKLGKNATATGVGGPITCGVLTVGAEGIRYSVPAANVVYNPFTVKLFGFLPLEGGLTVDGPAEGSLGAVEQELPDGEFELVGLSTTFEAPVTSTISFLGLAKCSIGPFEVALTTGKSGSLEGTYLTGEIVGPEGLTGTLVGNEFSVPKITPSKSCPFFISALSNLILGLPLKPGQSSVTTVEALKPELEEEDPPAPGLGVKRAHTGPVKPGLQ